MNTKNPLRITFLFLARAAAFIEFWLGCFTWNDDYDDYDKDKDKDKDKYKYRNKDKDLYKYKYKDKDT